MVKLAALALVVAAAAALPASGIAKEARYARAALPLKGVLVPGKSLAGVRLGDSPQQVLSIWGDNYRVCDGCGLRTWFFEFDHPDASHRGVGTGVVFRGNRAVAVFTLGTPLGWKTSDGLQLGDTADKAGDVYSSLRWHTCVGYSAMSMRPRADVVTSIYSAGETIYGFALTHASQPVCQ